MNHYIPMGKSKFSGSTVYFTERMKFGVHITAAVARYGKSIAEANKAVGIGQYRKIVWFDYIGEHMMRKFPNFLTSDGNTMCLPELVEIKGFKFKISQFNEILDWLSLGFTDKGAQFMKYLSQKKSKHMDDPELFGMILKDYPVGMQYSMLKKFSEKYGWEPPMGHKSLVDACETQYEYLLQDNFFGGTDDPVIDFGDLVMQHRHININFNLAQEEYGKARAIAGKILQQIERVIKYMKPPPYFVFEEADVLFPSIGEGERAFSSLHYGIKYVLKLQKYHPELCFIVQDLNNLHPLIVSNWHTMTLGRIAPYNPLSWTRDTNQLVWDIDRGVIGYREFHFRVNGKPGYDVFVPMTSSTMI